MSILIILFSIFFSIYGLYWVYIKPAYYESFDINDHVVTNTRLILSNRSKCFDCEHKPKDIRLNKSLLR